MTRIRQPRRRCGDRAQRERRAPPRSTGSLADDSSAALQQLLQLVGGMPFTEGREPGETEPEQLPLRRFVQLTGVRQVPLTGVPEGGDEQDAPPLRRTRDRQLGIDVADVAAACLEHEPGAADVVVVQLGTRLGAAQVALGEGELAEGAEHGADVAEERHAEQVVGVAEGGVLRRRDPPQRRRQVVLAGGDQGASPGRRGDDRRVVLEVAEIGDAIEPSGRGRQPVGLEQGETLTRQQPGTLGVVEPGDVEHLAEHGERLVEAPEWDQHGHRQVASAVARQRALATRVPRRRSHAERLGGELEVIAGLAGSRRQGEDLVGAGEGVLLAGSDVAQTAGGELDGALAAPAEELGTGDGRLDAPAYRRVGVADEGGGTIDVVDDLVEASQLGGGVGPQQQQPRFAVGDGAEAGEDAEHRSRLDRLGDRLRQRHQHARRPLRLAGVEQQSGRLERPVALGQCRRQSSRRLRLDVVGPVERGAEHVELARRPAGATGSRRRAPATRIRRRPARRAASDRCPACGRAARRGRGRRRRASAAQRRWRVRARWVTNAAGSSDGCRPH